MKTTINGKEAEWSEEILAKWIKCWRGTGDPRDYETTVSASNYFTPRPYVDEYNQGDKKEGFTYVIGRHVAMSVITGGVPWLVSKQSPPGGW